MNARKTIYTFEEFIQYRNKILTRLAARKKTFPNDKGLSYYEIRLIELNESYPEFAKIGKIQLKENEK